MSKIRILPDNVVSKIAAGEIVERPASVVKELVENSIDAGSTYIRIVLESGGKKLIEVSDDGHGMSRDEALLSLERHATSKITDIDDLFSVKSLGFRGEAIPSIASVSRFKIITRVNEDVAGTMISGEGGKIKRVEEAGCPSGTTIQVKNLFYNIPVRMKFMRTIETELSNVLDIVQREAMSWSETAFEIVSSGKTILHLPKRESLADRLGDIFPRTELQGILSQAGGVRVSGFMSSPLDTRSTTQKLYTYINKRAVRDKFLTRIIIDSYGRMLEKGKFPQGAVFIDMPAPEVDVNVHPTKNEVRFRNQRLIAELIRTAIDQMLGEAPWIKSYKGRVENSVSEFMKSCRAQTNYRENLNAQRHGPYFSETGGTGDISKNNDKASDLEYHAPATHKEPELPPIEDEGSSVGLFGKKGFYSNLKILGQLKQLYILCASENGMVLVDQHAAHERINYEKLKRAYAGEKALEVQKMLVPEVIELSPYESNLVNKHLEDFKSIGIEIENFGDNSFIVRSVPALLKNSGGAAMVKDVISEIASEGREQSVSDRIDLVIATMACHSSIRASFELNHEEMKALLSELDHMEFPHSCPHGRPVAQELSFYEIERMFKRS